MHNTWHYDRWIDVTVLLRDDGVSCERAIKAFTARGWTMAPATSEGRDSPFRAGYRAHVVTVGRDGGRWRARAAAVCEVAELIRVAGLRGAEVRDADFPERTDDNYLYRLHRVWRHTHSAPQRMIGRCACALGLLDTGDVARLRPGDNIRAEADRLERLRGHRVGDHMLRETWMDQPPKPRDPAAASREAASEAPRISDEAGSVLFLALFTMSLLLGAELPPARTANVRALLAAALLLTLLGAMAFVHCSGRRRDGLPMLRLIALTCFASAAITVIPATLGAVLSSRVPHLGPKVPVQIVLVLFGAVGTALLARRSWLVRAGLVAVPVALTLLRPVLPVGASTLYEVYLEDFGLRAAELPVSTLWRTLAGLSVVFLVLKVLLVPLGALGWLRYFHVRFRPAMTAYPVVALFLMTWVLLTIQGAMNHPARAADKLRSQAVAGRPPTAYFGVQPRLVCVRALSANIPIDGESLPTARPLLWFGTVTDRAPLWDPRTGETTRPFARDVAIVPAHPDATTGALGC
ncbi:hypothetical protein [Kitasatospora sp. NBC_01302]|uniref:hypothetical protein n=1 Tax=Kitasatospora sp. NBC_01302 TaxID=2903575 RepID=UPI002E0D81CE|nr:hypothetical protein OG294_12745 [Kitasatospora sp. NBC_01302]